MVRLCNEKPLFGGTGSGFRNWFRIKEEIGTPNKRLLDRL